MSFHKICKSVWVSFIITNDSDICGFDSGVFEVLSLLGYRSTLAVKQCRFTTVVKVVLMAPIFGMLGS
jgi:hypothetical protein